MSEQIRRAHAFAAMHVKGLPLVLFNAWDAGSAAVIAKAGARAIATGSWSVAAAHGFGDGEAMPFALALANIRRIVGAVDLPVSLDFEGGYATDPDSVAENFKEVLGTGVIGVNFEDRVVAEAAGSLYAIDQQAARLRALRQVADADGIPIFINARTDLFLQSRQHDGALVDAAIERAHAYAAAGASGFFVPGLTDAAAIGRLCAAVSLPVNVMYLPALPPPDMLAGLGVARISHGPQPYRLAMAALEQATRATLQSAP